MYLHTQLLINEIAADEPDPAAANALQEGLGGQFGEMRTMMQYLFQSMNFRGDAAAKPYKDCFRASAPRRSAMWNSSVLRFPSSWTALRGTKARRPTPWMNPEPREPHR